jgi:hypothetical protein
MVFGPRALFDAMFDLRKFGVGYNETMSGIYEGPACLTINTPWRYGLIASVRCTSLSFGLLFPDRSVVLTRLTAFAENLTGCTTAACAKGGQVEGDLLVYREQQKARI